MPNPKLDNHWKGGKRSKPPPLREYLRILREVFLTQFISEPFGLDKKKAQKCADEVVKVIGRNHRRARSAGLI